jgi:hypothetical protein
MLCILTTNFDEKKLAGADLVGLETGQACGGISHESRYTE